MTNKGAFRPSHLEVIRKSDESLEAVLTGLNPEITIFSSWDISSDWKVLSRKDRIMCGKKDLTIYKTLGALSCRFSSTANMLRNLSGGRKTRASGIDC